MDVCPVLISARSMSMSNFKNVPLGENGMHLVIGQK